MTDYIKREDAIKAVANNYWHGTECECYAFAHKALDGIQSADVVQVIRCKDCKHCEYASNRIPTEQAWVCYKLGIDVEQDWFCSNGERKDNE